MVVVRFLVVLIAATEGVFVLLVASTIGFFLKERYRGTPGLPIERKKERERERERESERERGSSRVWGSGFRDWP